MQTRICQGKPSREENMGTIAEEEAELLRGLVISLRPKCIAEIGTGWTRSLRAMRDGVKYLKDTLDWDCEIWTCDVAEAAVTRGKEIGGPITVVHGTVDDLVSQMPVPDLVFIDGSHEREDVAHDHQTSWQTPRFRLDYDRPTRTLDWRMDGRPAGCLPRKGGGQTLPKRLAGVVDCANAICQRREMRYVWIRALR